MATAADWVLKAKRHLGGTVGERLNKLAAPTPTEATTLTMQYELGPIQAGSVIQVGLELFHVWSVEQGSKTVTVEPMQQGSPTSAHDQGDMVTVNPRFADYAIFDALNDELLALSSPSNGLYAVKNIDLAGTTVRTGYNLPADVQEILEVRQQGYNRVAGSWPVVSNYRLARSVDATEFPGGTTLFLHDGVNSGREVRVRYRAAFTPLTSLATDVATTGLPVSAYDIPPMGAAVRLVAPEEIRRNATDSQGDSRRSGEVPAGAVAASFRSLAAMRQQRIAEESAALLMANPIGSHVPDSGGAWWR